MEITVNTSKPYRIVIGRGCLGETGRRAGALFRPGSRAFVVTDSNVAPLYLGRVRQSLSEAGFSTGEHVFPAGEESKQLSTIRDIYQSLAESGVTRSDFVVALGGGVTGDMAGFAAATFLRGIPFVQIPTSLLAQIDSSVGGKTGVDLPQGKNLVGAFHQPALVMIDPDTLGTLPPRFFSDGMGEAIKYGCIRSAELFEAIGGGVKGPQLDSMIAACINIKRQVVEHDEFDRGERMLLNFGHTFGHALEKYYGFGKHTHGEAVGIGMVMMARAGEAQGITEPGTAGKIAGALARYGLPADDPAPLDELLRAARLDKKGMGDTLNLIVLRKIGDSLRRPIRRDSLGAFMRGEAYE